ncbi:4Fe-4S binding protein [Melioribacteraceae bacterium 4301-Me]|uniref:4Fe-4S binding protein n=1 Tax=Pyranulibacter aquaticus TaxID=3163344 RepID=UPI003597E636
MKAIITDECINCSACAVECPTEAIYQPGKKWQLGKKSFEPISNDHFFIVLEICNSCVGLDNIKCIAICPMDAIKIV